MELNQHKKRPSKEDPVILSPKGLHKIFWKHPRILLRNIIYTYQNSTSKLSKRGKKIRGAISHKLEKVIERFTPSPERPLSIPFQILSPSQLSRYITLPRLELPFIHHRRAISPTVELQHGYCLLISLSAEYTQNNYALSTYNLFDSLSNKLIIDQSKITRIDSLPCHSLPQDYAGIVVTHRNQSRLLIDNSGFNSQVTTKVGPMFTETTDNNFYVYSGMSLIMLLLYYFATQVHKKRPEPAQKLAVLDGNEESDTEESDLSINDLRSTAHSHEATAGSQPTNSEIDDITRSLDESGPSTDGGDTGFKSNDKDTPINQSTQATPSTDSESITSRITPAGIDHILGFNSDATECTSDDGNLITHDPEQVLAVVPPVSAADLSQQTNSRMDAMPSISEGANSFINHDGPSSVCTFVEHTLGLESTDSTDHQKKSDLHSISETTEIETTLLSQSNVPSQTAEESYEDSHLGEQDEAAALPLVIDTLDVEDTGHSNGVEDNSLSSNQGQEHATTTYPNESEHAVTGHSSRPVSPSGQLPTDVDEIVQQTHETDLAGDMSNQPDPATVQVLPTETAFDESAWHEVDDSSSSSAETISDMSTFFSELARGITPQAFAPDDYQLNTDGEPELNEGNLLKHNVDMQKKDDSEENDNRNPTP